MYTTAFLRQFGEATAAVSKLQDTIEEVFGATAEIIFRENEVVVTDSNGILQSFQMTTAFAQLVDKAAEVKPRGRKAKATPENPPEWTAKSDAPAEDVPDPNPEPETGLSGPEPEDGGASDAPDPEEPAVQVSEAIRYWLTVEENERGIWHIIEHVQGGEDIVHGSENSSVASLRRAGELRRKYDADENRIQIAPVSTVPCKIDPEDPPF